jgi:hypothetical protein
VLLLKLQMQPSFTHAFRHLHGVSGDQLAGAGVGDEYIRVRVSFVHAS